MSSSCARFVQFAAADPSGSRLRSSTARAATIVQTRTKLGNRAFSVAGPSTWNSSPLSLHLVQSINQNTFL